MFFHLSFNKFDKSVEDLLTKQIHDLSQNAHQCSNLSPPVRERPSNMGQRWDHEDSGRHRMQ